MLMDVSMQAQDGPLSELLESASQEDVEAALDSLLRSKFNKERERLRDALSLQPL